MRKGLTFTLCAGLSLGKAYPASEPIMNSPPGIRTMSPVRLDKRQPTMHSITNTVMVRNAFIIFDNGSGECATPKRSIASPSAY